MEKQARSIPAARHEKILAWLNEEGSLSIQELQKRLLVSHMTIHRDLDILAGQGLVTKVRGGATRSIELGQQPTARKKCVMCGSRVSARTEVIFHKPDGSQVFACCPHCGLMMLADETDIESSLARDFIYGRMVNVYQAFYVVDSEVRICCVPSILCFANHSDADRFQKGFEGRVLNFTETVQYLMDTHIPNKM